MVALPRRYHAAAVTERLRRASASRAAYVVVCLALAGWTAAARAPGLDPQTLWADDVWVAAMTKLPVATALTLPAPVPPGFIALSIAARRVVSDPELSLQLLPFICGLAGPLLLGLVAARITGSRALGVVALSLGLISPLIAHYSVFVKQYTVDVAAAALLLSAGWSALAGQRHRTSVPADRWLSNSQCLAPMAAAISIPSLFISVPLVHLEAVVRLAQGWGQRRRVVKALAGVLVVDAVLATFYLAFLAGRRNPTLTAIWRSDFLPLASLRDAAGFLSTNGVGALATAVPDGWTALLFGVPIGLGWLLWRRDTRLFGTLLLLTYLAVLMASALHLYPIGVEFRARPILFLHAATLLLIVAGFDALRRLLARPAAIAAGLALAATAVTIWRPAPADYFPLDHSTLVRRLEAQAGAGDGIVLNLPAAYLTGYYGRWPIESVRDTSPQGFAVRLRRPLSLTLPRGAEEGAPPSPALADFLAREHPPRAFVFSSRRGIDAVEAAFAAHGYVERHRVTSRVSTVLIEYIRLRP